MIEQETVFILGAGASFPYGYPNGNELRTAVIDLIDFDESYFKDTQIKTTEGILNIKNFYGISDDILNHFLNLKKSLIGSRRSSIDIFLENRTEFCDIGKRCIAWDIIGHENPDITDKYDWFEYLHDQVLANGCSSTEEYCENNINFITFNYDRFLEYSLITSLKETYGQNESYCADKIKENFNMIHVHGKLDDLKWENPAGRAYGEKPVTQLGWKKSADGININHDEKIFKKARKLIENTEIIVFLGLNLHNIINLNRLRIKDNLEGKKIYATLKGLSGPQKQEVVQYFNNRLNRNLIFDDRRMVGHLPSFNAYELLKEHTSFR